MMCVGEREGDLEIFYSLEMGFIFSGLVYTHNYISRIFGMEYFSIRRKSIKAFVSLFQQVLSPFLSLSAHPISHFIVRLSSLYIPIYTIPAIYANFPIISGETNI